MCDVVLVLSINEQVVVCYFSAGGSRCDSYFGWCENDVFIVLVKTEGDTLSAVIEEVVVVYRFDSFFAIYGLVVEVDVGADECTSVEGVLVCGG